MDVQAKSLEVETLVKRKKRSLRRYRKNREKVERLETKLETLKERIDGLKSPSLSGMPRGGVPVSLDDLISDKLDLEDRIRRLKDKGHEFKKQIAEEIDSLDNVNHCDVLEGYFIDCLSIADIAENMGYSERYVYTLYQEAISLLSVLEQ